jgi:hypothetical protein
MEKAAAITTPALYVALSVNDATRRIAISINARVSTTLKLVGRRRADDGGASTSRSLKARSSC